MYTVFLMIPPFPDCSIVYLLNNFTLFDIKKGPFTNQLAKSPVKIKIFIFGFSNKK